MHESILVLEDQPSELRQVTSQQFPYSFTYHSIADFGKNANHYHLLLSHSYTLVVVDCARSIRDYIEVITRLYHDMPALPILVLAPAESFAHYPILSVSHRLDVLAKPFSRWALANVMRKLITMQHMMQYILQREQEIHHPLFLDDLIGCSPNFLQAVADARHISPTVQDVIVCGQAGTGKGVFIKALHHELGRGRIHTIDCRRLLLDASPKQRLARELEYSATQSQQAIDALLVRDVHLLPIALQDVLGKNLAILRGDRRFRIYYTSGQHPAALLQCGSLSDALLHLLDAPCVDMPSLDQRGDDVQLLATYLLRQHAARGAQHITQITPDTMALLRQYHWPGNITQLSATIARCCVFVRGDAIDAGTLRLVRQLEPVHYNQLPVTHDVTRHAFFDQHGQVKPLRRLEQEAIDIALASEGGSVAKAAQRLGIGRSTLYRRLYGHAQPEMARENQMMRPNMAHSSNSSS